MPKHDEMRHQKISAAIRKARRKNIGVRAAMLLSLPSMVLVGLSKQM